MKKISLLVLLVFGLSAKAQTTFKPGFRAGINFAHFAKGDSNYYDFYGDSDTSPTYDSRTRTDFYLAFQATIRFGKIYALQPEVNYSRQGGVLKNNDTGVEHKLTASYMSMQAVNKFYMNNLNFHLGPSIDYLVDYNNFDPDAKIDFGFLIGLGYDFTPNFGFEARIKTGTIAPMWDGEGHSNVLYQAGLYYTFNIQ